MAYVTADNFAGRPRAPSTGPFAVEVVTGTTGQKVAVVRLAAKPGAKPMLLIKKLGEVEKNILPPHEAVIPDAVRNAPNLTAKPSTPGEFPWVWIAGGYLAWVLLRR